MASAEKLKEIKDEYMSSLSDLTINSKPLINMLTMLADDNIENATIIVQAVEEHLEKVRSEYKLPVLYLIDSIVKNVDKAYTALFTQNIVANFCSVFEKVDERIRSQMFKLRQTWSDVFPLKKMYALDVRVNAIDPAWPIIAPPPSIHVNPRFLNTNAGTSTFTTSTAVTAMSTTPIDSTLDMRAQLISKQKELLELQQRKIELELLQAKVKLEEQQKQYALAQKNQRSKVTPPPTSSSSTTTASSTLPSMKTVLTKPNALPSVVKSTVEPKLSTKPIPKLASQISQPLSTTKQSTYTNGPRIAPVNSALIQTARNVPRDPRLAAKQALHQQQQSPQTTSSETSLPSVELKTSKTTNEPVNLEKTEKQKINTESNNKATINKINVQNTSSLNNIKDPRLISSKVHGPVSLQKGKSGSRDTSVSCRSKESGIPLPTRKVGNKKRQVKSDVTKTVDLTDNNSNNKFSKNDKNSSNDSKSRSSSHSPIKPKRKEHNSSPQKKTIISSSSTDSPTKRSPDKRSKYNKTHHTNNKYDVVDVSIDMDISNSPSPPLVVEVSNKVDDKSFKDLKGSTKSRNYIRRNRATSRSPDQVQQQTKDVDLRMGGPPEKQARIQSPIHTSVQHESVDKSGPILISNDNSQKPITEQNILDVNVAASKDVDLRQLPPAVPAIISKKRSSTDKLETSSTKKSKTEMFDVLFGNEDVDLRTLPTAQMPSQPPVQPPTPPPPVISDTTNNSNDGWQKVKENKSPMTPNTHLATVRAKLANATNRDRLGRPLLYNKLPDDPKERKRTISLTTTGDVDLRRLQKPPPIKTDAASIKLFLQQAEEERKSGKMSVAQYQNIMEQVIALIEKHKLRKAKRMESKKDISGNPDVNMSLQPISDDELSADFSEDDDEIERRSIKDVDERQPPLIPTTTSTISLIEPHTSTQNPPFDSSANSLSTTTTSASSRIAETNVVDSSINRSSNSKSDPRTNNNERDTAPPVSRTRRWDGGNEQSHWDRPSHQLSRPSPWIHPPLGLMEKQNPYYAPWKPLNFMPPIPPIQGIFPSTHDQQKDATENRPNVAVGGFVQRPPVVRYGPRSASPPAIGSQTTRELPHADPLVLEYINNDSMRTINIDGNPTEIRYYGDTAVAMMNGDEPIEISFQNGTRRISFGEKESYMLSFNDVARDVTISGVPHRVRLGAPTRELYIDDKWYECFFGGPGIVIEIDREYRVVKLEGPPPQVKFGNKRTDLCVGRINLIINAKNIVPIFLDAKPQKFDIEGKLHTLRFVDALRTVLINEEPFKVDFGGLPKPIIVHNKKHFIRFTRLPPGIRPGYVDIKDMEGQRFAGSPPRIENENSMDKTIAAIPPPTETSTATEVSTNEPALPMFGKRRPNLEQPPVPTVENPVVTVPPPSNNPVLTSNLLKNFNLDLLSSIITPAMAPSSNINASGYKTDLPVTSTENPEEIPGLGGLQTQSLPPVPPPPVQPQTPAIGLTAPPRSFEELKELIQKLEATGILNNVSESLQPKEPKVTEIQDNVIKPVDFAQPETLKAKQPAIVSALYSGMQCSSCGVRFPPEHTIKYSRQHLDWHYRQNKKKKHSVRKANSRKWFYDVSDWIQFEEIEDLEEREKSWFENQQVAASNTEGGGTVAEEASDEIEIPSVEARSAGENPRCDVCYDVFDQFYNEEKEEWHLRMAIRVDDKLYHPLCYEDYKTSLADVSITNSALGDTIVEIRDETDDTSETKEMEDEIKKIELDDDDDDEDGVSVNPPDVKETNDRLKETETTEEDPTKETEIEMISEAQNKNESNEEENDDNLDNSEPDVCIILPEEEIPIVKIDDNNDDDEDVFNQNDESSSNETQKSETKEYKMVDVVLADGSIVKIKSEPLEDITEEEPSEEILPSTADTTHAAVLSSIDGNVQMEPTVNMSTNVPSAKIKINISKPLISSQPKETSASSTSETSKNQQQIETATDSSSEPPPPGEETPQQIKLKPALQGVNLKIMPPVTKGSELSGLCSIM